MQSRIEEKLRQVLSPSVLDVINESSNHSVPKGSETHFKVVIVSAVFEGKIAVKRHRLVYDAMGELMTKKPGVHALSIIAKTPDEWSQDETIRKSPECAGGSKVAR
ncbi:MAG: BolA family protein [Polyangiaceae bacterium]